MPEPKSAGQRVLNLQVDRLLVEAIDAARRKSDETRSAWVRKAIAERLRAGGVEVPAEWVTAPDRAGKGGRPRKGDYVAQRKAGPGREAKREKQAPRAAEGVMVIELTKEEQDPEVEEWIVDRAGNVTPVRKKKEAG